MYICMAFLSPAGPSSGRSVWTDSREAGAQPQVCVCSSGVRPPGGAAGQSHRTELTARGSLRSSAYTLRLGAPGTGTHTRTRTCTHRLPCTVWFWFTPLYCMVLLPLFSRRRLRRSSLLWLREPVVSCGTTSPFSRPTAPRKALRPTCHPLGELYYSWDPSTKETALIYNKAIDINPTNREKLEKRELDRRQEHCNIINNTKITNKMK